MNRKSLYCCPTILAALVVATGAAPSVQAQEATQPRVEVAALDSSPEPEAIPVIDAVVITTDAPEPIAALQTEQPQTILVSEGNVSAEVAEEASDIADPVAVIATSESVPIAAWSSDAEIAPALAELVAESEVASQAAPEIIAAPHPDSDIDVSIEASDSAEVSLAIEQAVVIDEEEEAAVATTASEAIPPFQPSAEVPVGLASLASPLPAAQPAPSIAQVPDLETAPPAEPAPSEVAPSEAVPSEATSTEASEPRVLVAEVQVSGVEGNSSEAELLDAVYDAIQTRPGQPTTSTQLQEDLNSIFATGYFENVNFRPEDTPLGVRVRFIVDPNPVLQAVVAPGTQVLPAEVVEQAFASQYGEVLNFNDLQDGVKRVNTWYQDNGYVLAQVVDATQVSEDGTVNLQIAEGVVDSIDVRFLDADGNATTETGEAVSGRTKPYVVAREFSLKPGDVFSRDEVEKSSQRVFGLGIFEDVRLSLDPAPEDPRKVVVVVNVIEARTGSIGASGGVSSASGLFGSFNVGQENFRGRNQKLRSEITLGQRDFLFDVGYTDPWIKNDPYRTSYTVNAFRRRSVSLIYSGGDTDVDLPNGDTPRILRLGGGVRFSRPLSKNVFEPSEWSASAGLQYQRISIRDQDGDNENQDEFGNDLTFSGDDNDDLILLQLGAARDRRNSRLQPTQGSITRFNLDQSVPVGSGSILMNRFRVNHSQFIPVNFLRLTEGCKESGSNPTDCPQTLAFNIQAGNIFGDLPPYEAFSIGGSNSVRGYGEGEVGSGRRFLQATAEYRFPVFSFVGGALFADVGTDLGSGEDVPGDPAGIREKPGSGYGIGLGVRVQSPLGPIRADYTVLTDDGDSRFQFGIGQRF